MGQQAGPGDVNLVGVSLSAVVVGHAGSCGRQIVPPLKINIGEIELRPLVSGATMSVSAQGFMVEAQMFFDQVQSPPPQLAALPCAPICSLPFTTAMLFYCVVGLFFLPTAPHSTSYPTA